MSGSESGPPVVKGKLHGAAVLPCTGRCSGVVSWTVLHKHSDILAECDQTSCRSVKEGYQMIYNQYLQGDFSLIISEADYSKRGLYTCDCDDTDLFRLRVMEVEKVLHQHRTARELVICCGF
ncbi:hypothetical protein AMEX_G25200 [Astyanax mexicanus]|uniref:Uncharacterized protein n=1 Tax=Astyanax mexicanus TaxID=7994 RepID=A0A8T2KX46_ASTMX|nr:hypothetical protein AMEX_G25200 [Astyanax mexicanus]